MIDTSVAVYLRDRHHAIAYAVAALTEAPMISILTRVELEGGVYREQADSNLLRQRVDALLGIVRQLPFTEAEAEIYGRIVAACGFSRRRIVDRMIAATALAEDAVLITINGDDFSDIPGLKLEVWKPPSL